MMAMIRSIQRPVRPEAIESTSRLLSASGGIVPRFTLADERCLLLVLVVLLAATRLRRAGMREFPRTESVRYCDTPHYTVYYSVPSSFWGAIELP